MNDSLGAQLGAIKDKIEAISPTPEPISQGQEFEQQPRPSRTNPRKRMRDDTNFGGLGGPETVTVQFGQTKTSMHMSEADRKKMAESIIKQQNVANASGWADVASRFGMAALSVVGAVATTWALVQGVKSATKGD